MLFFVQICFSFCSLSLSPQIKSLFSISISTGYFIDRIFSTKTWRHVRDAVTSRAWRHHIPRWIGETGLLWVRDSQVSQTFWNQWIVYIGVVFKAITSVAVTRNSHYCTCLGHFGCCHRDRIISIYVAPPKVANASKACHFCLSLSPALLRQLSPMEM